MKDCLNKDATKRPTFSDLKGEIDIVIKLGLASSPNDNQDTTENAFQNIIKSNNLSNLTVGAP